MSWHRLFYFRELKEPKATHGLFPSLSWCCYRVEWRSGQKFQDTCLDVGDCVIEVWQHRFVLAADPGGVEYDAGQIDGLMAARFKKRRAEAAQDTSASRNAGGEPRGRRGLGEGTMAMENDSELFAKADQQVSALKERIARQR